MDQSDNSTERSGAQPSSTSSPSSPSGPRGFRWTVWGGVAVIVALGIVMVIRSNAPAVDIELTLITSDRADVACLSPSALNRFACDFSAEGKPREPDEAKTLRPYMTVHRQVYLIPGLFLEANLQNRYKSEPPNVPREQLRRFVAKCRVKKLGRIEGVKLRWLTTGGWGEAQRADVVTVERCQVVG